MHVITRQSSPSIVFISRVRVYSPDDVVNGQIIACPVRTTVVYAQLAGAVCTLVNTIGLARFGATDAGLFVLSHSNL